MSVGSGVARMAESSSTSAIGVGGGANKVGARKRPTLRSFTRMDLSSFNTCEFIYDLRGYDSSDDVFLSLCLSKIERWH